MAEPGLVVVTPGSGVIMLPPVSVCHQVSTIGHDSSPMCSWYHIHASGLIGSPTVPSTRRVEITTSRPLRTPLHEGSNGGRGGVELGDAVTLDDVPETIFLPRSPVAFSLFGAGVSGVPSYITDVAPFVSGP